ncbi:MAG: CRISPR-associated endonuclease/helicase Cas3, partial [Archaeoglobi archaeon]|nr:CRISPR-associated endonuclease/helicase Cas3 [Archaeoglobi archaeon]
LKLFETLQPLKKSESEEHVYKMFQGLEVVPRKYYEKAIEAVEKGRGIEIYRYLVSIPYWKYFALQDRFGNVFDYDSKHRIVVANLKYSSEHGLLDEIESDVEIL